MVNPALLIGAPLDNANETGDQEVEVSDQEQPQSS